MKWFKHDSNAHTDDKIQKVLMKYGADGYGLYWYCIELISERVTPENITFELKHDAEVLGFYLKIDTLRVEEIMKYLIKLELFNVEGKKIHCYKLAKRLDNATSQNKEIKETLNNFKKLKPTLNNLKPLKAEENRLDKNRKDIKIKNRTNKFVRPTLQDVINQCGNQHEGENYFNYYESNGWKVGKNSMKNWKAALTNWIKRSGEYNGNRTSERPVGAPAKVRAAIAERDRKQGITINAEPF